MRARARVGVVALVATLGTWGGAAAAGGLEDTFRPGAFVLSVEGGGGSHFDLEHKRPFTPIDNVNAGVRFGWLPFGATGAGIVRGALELGLEPFYQRYLDPAANFGGLAAVARYHLLWLGRFVPYVEVAGAAGGTDLRIREIDSSFTFLLFGGIGASYFVTDRTAVYAGYRLQHVSNGGTDSPNRGLESHTGVMGVSFFFE